LILVINYVLLGPFVGLHIDCKNMNGMGNIQFTNAQQAKAAVKYKNINEKLCGLTKYVKLNESFQRGR
jgi:hypothetical protein